LRRKFEPAIPEAAFNIGTKTIEAAAQTGMKIYLLKYR
jgi:hypothetical protein